MNSIRNFENAVSNQIDRMISLGTELFYVETDRDELFDLYLKSFPEGTNPLYRERTVHDCSTCKRFIQEMGNVVAVINGRIESIWDVRIGDFYDIIANALAETVRFRRIAGVCRNQNKTLGGPENRETLENGIINIYEHFHYTLPSQFVNIKDIASIRGTYRTNKEVLERSLTEISLDAGEEILDLIEENQLLRGQQFLPQVEKFVETKRLYDMTPKNETDTWLWLKSVELKEFGRFRNTVIGTLLDDVSKGIDIVTAVKKYENKVHGSNYKRPTALVSQKMIDRAEEKIDELGIKKSLSRRYAVEKDLTINNVLFVNKSTKKKMKKGKKKKGILANIEPTKSQVDPDKIQSMLMDEFIHTVLPHVDSIEVMVENMHTNNLMSIIAPFHKRSPNIMKHGNPFSWGYIGEVTDSIKERVKKAGGNVDADMRFSLSWDYYDDLDIHVIEPNGNEIYYGNKRSPYSSGFLDVDMNVNPDTLEPVENTAWADRNRIQEGRYNVFVENFNKRDMNASGFEVQMEIDGQTSLFSYNKPLRNKERVQVIKFDYTHNKGLVPVKALLSSTISKEVWGIETQKWSKVNMLLLSPNFWNGEKTGNKHWFFILDNCLNPDRARGFYNELLMDDLKDHRKTFELLSSKMKTERSDKQLSGVGFSISQKNHIVVRVEGKFSRMIKIEFAPNMDDRFESGFLPKMMFEKPKEICTCEVCKRTILITDSRLPCPECDNIFHTSHFLESVRVTGKCPVCRESINQYQIDEIVQLVTV